jgi:hypothetical protein
LDHVARDDLFWARNTKLFTAMGDCVASSVMTNVPASVFTVAV